MIWKDVMGWEGYYKISSRGNILSIIFKDKSKLLTKHITHRGYEKVTLSAKERKHLFVHRLVAEAFIPNPDNKPFVNHIDGNKLNNCVENLEWCTYEENLEHAIVHNLIATGERVHTHKLTNEDVLNIRELGKTLSGRKIAKLYNVAGTTIHSIINNKTWRYI